MAHVPIPELVMFAQVNATNPNLLGWLQREREDVIKVLTHAVGEPMVYRAQGKLEVLNRQIDLLSTSSGHIAKIRAAGGTI